MSGNAGTAGLTRVRQQVTRRVRQAEILARSALGLEQPERKLAEDAQDYWETGHTQGLPHLAHWRGGGPFHDERWHALGRAQLEHYDRLAPTAGRERGGPLGRVVEWGCGGGANAVAFAPRAAGGYVGVDVARPTLDACAREMAAIGRGGDFTPVLIDIARPEAALERVPAGSCDLFTSFHVFELFPTPEYGLRVMGIAHRVLREGGAAFVQIRFDRGSVRTAPRRWGYVRNVCATCTYRVEAFWEAAQGLGFEPHAVFLLPYQELNEQNNYAYFLMSKRRQPAAA
jgi:SAM-dependent methyltransferase